MPTSDTPEQHLAVFGGSGSGKTVLLSSFYGATQQPEFWSTSHVEVNASDTGQGHRLLKNYNGMRDRGIEPLQTRRHREVYDFSVRLRKAKAASRSALFDAFRLVWHDYPGEWFEASFDAEQEQRRVDTFRDLLRSDIAILLVDGQQLLDHVGEEERYLRTLFGGVKNLLRSIERELLDDGQRLVQFPRIWILALSKADLLPDMDVFAFRDLLVDKALDDLNELRSVLGEFVESPEALDLGEDFLRLSSAKFEPGKIEVTERTGVDLILPLAATLPLERHVQWIEQRRAGGEVAVELAESVGPFALALIGRAVGALAKVKGPVGFIATLLATKQAKKVMADAVKLAGEQLRLKHDAALAEHDFMSATLTEYRIALERAEAERVLLLSKK